MKKMNNKGFSLVELIIVIAIMAVLVGVLAPQFIKYVESSKQSTDIDNVSSYKTAVEAFMAEDTSDDITITITTTGVYASEDFSDIGLAAGSSSETKFKSSGWNAHTWVYDSEDFTWTKGGTGASKNNNKPEKDLATIFE